VGRNHAPNGGWHGWAVDNAHPANAGLEDDIAFLLKVWALHQLAVSNLFLLMILCM
jgi:hypothetical protein